MRSIKYNLVCLVLLFFSFESKSQLAGVYTVPGSYTTIAQAITDINTYGITGAVTINIAAGYTETASAGGYSLYTVIGGSTLNTVTFQKSGSGLNPTIYSYTGMATPSSAIQDGVWRLIGADNITIDHIDIYDANSSITTSMEFGYGFFKANTVNGCQNNTIKNCKIKLFRLNNALGIFPAMNGSRGIELVNATCASHTTALNITSPSGAHSGNRFYSNTIYDCHIGISMVGFLSPSTSSLSDLSNDIGGISSASSNTITNFGGSGTLTPSSAIYTYGQYSINVSNNIINNNTGTGANHQTTLRGIYLTNAPGANVVATNNTVTVSGGASTVQVSAIENTSGVAANDNTVNISNNVVSGCTQTLNTTGTFYGIWNSANAEHILITGNTFTNNYNSVTTGTTYLIYNTGDSRSSIDLSNNIFTYALTSTHSGLIYGINNSAGTASTIVNINNNQFSNYNCAAANSSGRFHFLYASGTNSTISFNYNAWNSLTITTQGGFGLMINASSSQAGVSVKSNSIVSGFTIPGLAGDLLCYNSGGFSAAAANVTITGNNFSNVTATGYGNGSFYGISHNDISPAPYAHVEIYDNIISNIYYNGGIFLGIYARYLGEGSVASRSAIYSNTITNIDTWGTSYGINLNPNNSPNYRTVCYNNLISNMTAREDGDQVFGAYIQCQGSAVDFYSNKICNITHTGTITSKAMGIKVTSGTDIRIYNNLIGNILATNATMNDASGNDASTGIYVSDGPSTKIYFNTVFLTGSSLGSSCINATNTTTYIDLKNNIFVNLCTSTGTSSAYCLRRSNNVLSAYELTSNNNLFYAGIPGPNNILLRLGSTNYTTLPAMKSILLGREWNSVTENPTFASTLPASLNYLVPNTSTPTQIESGAMPIAGINTDYFNASRNTSFPDIGAIEDSYTPMAFDLNAPTISGPGFTSPGCNTSSRTFTVTLSDISGISSGSLSPRVYYKVNNGSYTSSAGTLTSGTPTIGVWTFSLSYVASAYDIISYYLVAQDNAGSPNLAAFPQGGFSGNDVNTITTSPLAPFTYTIYNTLGGTYTVGASGTFTSLTAAANAYNERCLTSSVTFILSDALYSANEIFPITFLNNPDASATNSLLIKPDIGVASVIQRITNTNPTTTIKLFDARYITLEGLNNSGSSLTVVNTNTYAYPSSGIWMTSENGGNKNIGINNITFKALSNDYSYGILATENGSVLPSSPFSIQGGSDNDNVTINSNTFLKQGYGIASYGASVSITGANDNWLIANNQIGPVSSSTDNMQYTGIILQNVVQSSVNNNTISNIVNANYNAQGIQLGAGSASLTIERNTIRSIKHNGIAGLSGFAIDINTGSNYSNIVIKNNMVCDLLGNARTTFTSGGFAAIRVGAYATSSGIKFYNNTIAINQATAAPGYTNNSSSAAIYFSPLCSNIELKNNLFYSNTQFTTFTNTTTYAIYSHAPASAFNVMDYNSFFSGGTQAVLAYLNGPLTSIAAIQNAFGQNNNSINMLPAFTSSTDLHIDLSSSINYFFDNKGSPIPGVTIDIDNQSRNISTPDIGADEFNPVITCTNAAGGNVVSSSSVCAGGPSLTLSANGPSGGVGTVYQWQVSAIPGGPYSNVTIGSNPNTPAYTLGAYPAGMYYFIMEATCTSLSLTGISNEATVSVVAPPVITASSSQSIVCSGNTVTLSANGAASYTWSNGFQGPVTVITPTSAGIYNVIGYTSPCPAIQSNDILVYYAVSPTLAITSPSNSLCSGNTTTLYASGANSYTWNSGPQTSSIIVTPTITTTYTIIGTSNSCNSQTVKTITVNPLPLIIITSNSAVCLGSFINLSGNGALTYTWSNNATSASILVSPAINTTYSVIGKDVNGCVNSTSTNITVLALPVITAQASNTVVCAGNSLTLSGNGGQSYIWSGGVINNTAFFPASTGIYTVTGTGANGCQASSFISIIVNLLPNTNISTTNTLICIGETATLTASGAVSYSWSTTESTSSITITPVTSTVYTVTGTDINGCSKTYSLTQVVDPCAGLSSQNSEEKLITIYPSPNTGKFYIHQNLFESKDCRVEIINELGEMIYSSKVERSVFLIDITEQANGIYFINYMSGYDTVRKKIIKQ